MEVTLNQEQELFVINSGASVSCLGFDIVFQQAKEAAKRLLAAGLQAAMPDAGARGTMAQYEQYRALMAQYLELGDTKTWFDERTPAKVQAVLERYRQTRKSLRVFYGDAISGRDWLGEFDTVGTVGRSIGPMKVPLLVAKGESGGSALLTANIVRMVDAASGKELYRHPEYHQPELLLLESEEEQKEQGFQHCVWVRDKFGDLQRHASFTTLGGAGHWLAYITGTLHVHPDC